MQQRPASDPTDILVAIQALSPSQRRRLLRRLGASGLLDPEDLLTDQHRLDVAPALGVGISRWREEAERVPEPATAASGIADKDEAVDDKAIDEVVAKAEIAAPVTPPPTTRPKADDDVNEYRSPVSGKVVMGTPSELVEDDPYAMHPVPGQAPERPIVIIFDGGSKGNPGKGYGSYALRWPGQQERIVKLQFGDNVTNNEAEYDTLIAALEATLARLNDLGAGAATAQVTIRGDSLLVINQVKGEWKCKEKRMQLRRDRVRALLDKFGRWELIHHDRSNSVRVLGH